MAHQLIEGGGVKQDWDYLESLAGVGHKTASVVLSQWFGSPFPVDTHIHRLAARWGLSNGKNVDKTEKDLKRFGPKMNGIEDIYKLYFLERALPC